MICPPQADSFLCLSIEQRTKAHLVAVAAPQLDEQLEVAWTNTGLELQATLQAEELAAYEMVYRYAVKEQKAAAFGKGRDLLVILDRVEPHPVYGELERSSAASFYESLLRESEGERLNLW